MNIKAFVEHCDLPPDWEEWVQIEVLTGCTCCGRRLLVTSANGQNQTLRLGVTALRVRDCNGVLIACHVLCPGCVPKRLTKGDR